MRWIWFLGAGIFGLFLIDSFDAFLGIKSKDFPYISRSGWFLYDAARIILGIVLGGIIFWRKKT